LKNGSLICLVFNIVYKAAFLVFAFLLLEVTGMTHFLKTGPVVLTKGSAPGLQEGLPGLQSGVQALQGVQRNILEPAQQVVGPEVFALTQSGLTEGFRSLERNSRAVLQMENFRNLEDTMQKASQPDSARVVGSNGQHVKNRDKQGSQTPALLIPDNSAPESTGNQNADGVKAAMQEATDRLSMIQQRITEATQASAAKK